MEAEETEGAVLNPRAGTLALGRECGKGLGWSVVEVRGRRSTREELCPRETCQFFKKLSEAKG